jgi:hypothetical protein
MLLSKDDELTGSRFNILSISKGIFTLSLQLLGRLPYWNLAITKYYQVVYELYQRPPYFKKKNQTNWN